jgi:hypothetical protein
LRQVSKDYHIEYWYADSFNQERDAFYRSHKVKCSFTVREQLQGLFNKGYLDRCTILLPSKQEHTVYRLNTKGSFILDTFEFPEDFDNSVITAITKARRVANGTE